MNQDLLNFIKSNSNTTFFIKEYNPITISKYINSFFVGDKGLRYIYSNNQLTFHNNILRRDGRVNVELEKNLTIEMRYGNVFIFTDHYGDKTISHWMADQMFVILYLHDLIKLIPDLKIIVNKNRRPCMQNCIREILLLIPGVEEKNIIEFSITNKGRAIACNNLYIGNGIRCGWTNINRLWKLLMKKGLQLNLSDTIENKKIYLSRRHTVPQIYGSVNPRKLVNVEDVSKKIVSLGYEEVFTEKLTFEEKIDLFRNTKDIICEIGAGIINFIHCENKPHIKIMLQDTPANHDFLRQWDTFLKTLDVTYEPIFGERVPTNDRIVNPINTPWKLDLNKIK